MVTVEKKEALIMRKSCERAWKRRQRKLPWQPGLTWWPFDMQAEARMGVNQCTIHRNLESTNILLDEKLVGKVVDLRLSKAASHRPELKIWIVDLGFKVSEV